MRNLTLFLFVLTFSDALACSCKGGNLRSGQAVNFKYSELIAAVDVFDYDMDSGIVKALVLEELKGDFVSDTLLILNMEFCGVHVTLGRWLLYLTMGETTDGVTIPVVDGCSISRSFANPHHIGVDEYQPPPPPMREIEGNDAFYTEWEANICERAHRDLMAEVRVLRSRH